MLKNIKISRQNKGITLITLVITIIVLLILSGITIGAITGENGIIKNAGKAKEQSEIDNEKEIINVSIIQTMSRNRYGEIEEKEFQESIDDNSGENKAKVEEDGEYFIVEFIKSGRYYKVDGEGKIEIFETYEDTTPGELATEIEEDENGNKTTVYKIESIEDLVVFSMMTNGGNKELGISVNYFINNKVILERTLDFKSKYSYSDYTTTKYGDLNKDGKIEDLKTELTKTEEGCIGFTPMNRFGGIFDGQNNEIQNIYMYNGTEKKIIAFFASGYSANTIENLSITGTIINKAWHAGGIFVGNSGSKIINCKNYADVTGHNMAGGISLGNVSIIEGCENYGNITMIGAEYSYSGAGGIMGNANGSVKQDVIIKDCINYGDVKAIEVSKERSGGILAYGAYVQIINCINKGKCDAGIVTCINNHEGNNIINCYNLGECTSGIINEYAGGAWTNILELNIQNCYNLGKAENGILGSIGRIAEQITLNIENCYTAGESQKAIIGIINSEEDITITNIKNTYYDKSEATSVGVELEGITGIDSIKNNNELVDILNNNIGENTNWNRWKLGEDGYPTFE